MSRVLSASMQSVATADVVRPIVLVELQFDGATTRLWSGIGTLDWNSQEWNGAGQLLAIDRIEEPSEVKAVGTTITLNGVPSDIISLALQEDYQGRVVKIYLGAFDEAGDVIASPVVIFAGRMDVMSIQEAGDFCQIAISVENRLIDFERARIRRYTDQDQKIDFPLDKGLEFVSSIQEKQIVWGRV